VISLLAMSLIRVAIGVVPAALLAIPLYHYSIFAMGLPLVAFVVVLMAMGWALGLAICGLIIRHGMGAESLAWTVIFALSPVSCVYYPVTTLPQWLQLVAWAFPQTYVFEGMRTVMFEHVFRTDYFFAAVGLDLFRPKPQSGSPPAGLTRGSASLFANVGEKDVDGRVTPGQGGTQSGSA